MTTGDGGMITTNNKIQQTKLESLETWVINTDRKRWKNRNIKDIFQSPNYSRHDDIGLNCRMSEFQILLV